MLLTGPQGPGTSDFAIPFSSCASIDFSTARPDASLLSLAVLSSDSRSSFVDDSGLGPVLQTMNFDL